MFDVITVGSAAFDVFVETGEKLFQKTRKGMVKVPFGSKILIKEIKFSTGGGGTNAAIALSRLGFKTAFLGKLGTDSNSHHILSELRKDKVHTSLVKQEKGIAGYSVILDAKGHDRTILVYKGANDDLKTSDVRWRNLRTRWFYFSSMVGTSYKTLEKIAMFADKKGMKIAFNPSAYIAKKGKRFLYNILLRTDMLILNDEEADYIVGTKHVDNALKKLTKLGPKTVVITMGRKGARCLHNNKIYKIRPHKIKIVEATGAGDAFASTFLAGMIKTDDAQFSLKLALANAESVIMHYGAKNKLLKWNELIKKVK
jgi:ribokinase